MRPNETLPLENYINDIVPILQKRGYADRTSIQSFDWRTLVGIKKKFPKTKTVALLDYTTIVAEDRGVPGYPWLGGVNVRPALLQKVPQISKELVANLPYFS